MQQNVAAPSLAEIACFLRLPRVIEKTGLKRSTLYALIKQGKFPRQIKLTQHSSGWSSSEIAAWMAGRIAASSANNTVGV